MPPVTRSPSLEQVDDGDPVDELRALFLCMLQHVQGYVLVHDSHSPGEALGPPDVLWAAVFVPVYMYSPALQAIKITSRLFAICSKQFLVFQKIADVLDMVFDEIVHAIFRIDIGYIATAFVRFSRPARTGLVDDKHIDIGRRLFRGDGRGQAPYATCR